MGKVLALDITALNPEIVVYYLYYNSEVCVCVCLSVCLCRFYLKKVNGNDLILFAT